MVRYVLCKFCQIPIGLRGYSPAKKIDKGEYAHLECLRIKKRLEVSDGV